MAWASTSNQGSPRRLAELLDEQQEPFVLEIYLLERGYRIQKSLDLDNRVIGCCYTNNTNQNLKNNQFLKKSSSFHTAETPISRKSSKQFSSIVSTLFYNLVLRKGRRTKGKENNIEPGSRCSSVSNTWSESDTDAENNYPTHKKSAPTRLMTRWRSMDENKQCSPISVLDEIDLHQAIPTFNARRPNEKTPAELKIRFQEKVSEDAILSASLWQLLVQLRKKPKQKRRKPFPEYMNSKKALQQNRQLLFDCTREAVEMGKQQNSSNSNREKGLKIGPEEIGNFICKNMRTWGTLSPDGTNIKQVLKMDLLGDKWSDFQVWKKEIVAEIGYGIIEDITEQIIRDMID